MFFLESYEWFSVLTRYNNRDKIVKKVSGHIAVFEQGQTAIKACLNVQSRHFKRICFITEKHLFVGKLKLYFYILRPLLVCRWILAEGTPPPVPFSSLVDKYLSGEIKPDVEKPVDMEKNTHEIGKGKY